jgi:hypothetical protein
MNTLKFVASLLIVAGSLGAAYGGFNYTKKTHEANIGPIQLQVKEKEHVNIPMWAGLGTVGIGLVLLLIGSRKK